MVELIPKCWNADPTKRPSFDNIFDPLFSLFKSRQFGIVIRANPNNMRDSCQSVVNWEKNHPFSA
jgi:hypothetical protein